MTEKEEELSLYERLRRKGIKEREAGVPFLPPDWGKKPILLDIMGEKAEPEKNDGLSD